MPEAEAGGWHEYAAHVRFSDVDVYGHVNNVIYFVYYQEARIAFLADHDVHLEDPTTSMVVARLDVDYRRPLLFRAEPYVVRSRVEELGRSSVVVRSEIVDDAGTVFSTARSVVVGYDAVAGRSRPLTEAERAALAPRGC